MNPPRAPDPSQLAGLFQGIELTAVLAGDVEGESWGDWQEVRRAEIVRSSAETAMDLFIA
jgi:hypothetical protein